LYSHWTKLLFPRGMRLFETITAVLVPPLPLLTRTKKTQTSSNNTIIRFVLLVFKQFLPLFGQLEPHHGGYGRDCLRGFRCSVSKTNTRLLARCEQGTKEHCKLTIDKFITRLPLKFILIPGVKAPLFYLGLCAKHLSFVSFETILALLLRLSCNSWP
jgi:hypothetical protein